MKDYKELKQDYFRIKDILLKVSDSDRQDEATRLLKETLTIEEVEQLRSIANQYEDMGFHLLQNEN